MKKCLTVMFLLLLVFGLTQPVIGEEEEKIVSNSEAAIQFSEIFNSIDRKVEYLVKQGNYFIQNGKFEQAQKIAEHILLELDSSSEEAKTLLEKSKDEDIPEVDTSNTTKS